MVIKFKGSSWFRQRIICATLSGKSISINEIRARDEQPGVKEYEVSLLRLIEKITNGCKIEIDHTGTSVYYRPGVIIGGKVEHDCGNERGIGYFLEALVCLAPFGKDTLDITLHGITNPNNDLDVSVDIFKSVTIPMLNHFGINENIHLKVIKRGAPPSGCGTIQFSCPCVPSIKTINLSDEGKIKRIRGISYTSRVSHQMSVRMIENARKLLSDFCDDVYIHTDEFKKSDSGPSSGYGLILVAETTSGCFLSSERMAKPKEVPEDVSKDAVEIFLLEVLKGGCVDSFNQSIAIFLMALSEEAISTLRIGSLSDYSIQLLKYIKSFFGITFKIESDISNNTVILKCLGTGYKNLYRRVL